MKSKKTKKSYATGGAMDSILPLLSSLGGIAGGANPALGLIGTVPGLIQGYMNQQRQNATVVSATPGNYAVGGPINSIPFLPLMQDPFLPTFIVPTIPSNNTIDKPYRKGLSIPPKPALPTDYVPAPGNSSTHSKSKERFREYATGGPIGGPGPDKTNTGFFGDDANVRPIRAPRNKITKPLQFVGRYEDPNYQEKLLKSLSRETG
jgi:hypothetical protein